MRKRSPLYFRNKRRDAVFAENEPICNLHCALRNTLTLCVLASYLCTLQMGSFRRKHVFGPPPPLTKTPTLGLRRFSEAAFHLSKNWFDYTHPSTPCPAELSDNDTWAKSISGCNPPVLTGRRSRKAKLGHYRNTTSFLTLIYIAWLCIVFPC